MKEKARNLTGDDVGRMMILDLVESYKSLLLGNGDKGLYTGAEKAAMVGALTKPDDIHRYNEYKYIHDFLNVAPAIYESYAKTYEVYYWRAYYMIKELKDAEEEYRRLRPAIMTKKQYEEFRLDPEGNESPRIFGGIAVLEPEFYPLDYISDDGMYVEPEAFWRANLAESFIEKSGAQLRECLSGIKNMLRECLSRQTAVELVGNFINIPDVVMLLDPVDMYEVAQLNHMMVSVTDGIERRGGKNERTAAELKKELKELLAPIDTKSLAPTKKAMDKAAARLDFSTAQGNMEAFIAMLKRGGGNA